MSVACALPSCLLMVQKIVPTWGNNLKNMKRGECGACVLPLLPSCRTSERCAQCKNFVPNLEQNLEQFEKREMWRTWSLCATFATLLRALQKFCSNLITTNLIWNKILLVQPLVPSCHCCVVLHSVLCCSSSGSSGSSGAYVPTSTTTLLLY